MCPRTLKAARPDGGYEGKLFVSKDLGFVHAKEVVLDGAITLSEARNTEDVKEEASKAEDGKESGARTGMAPAATRPAQAHPGTSRARAPSHSQVSAGTNPART